MPWKVFRDGNRYCVHKLNTDDSKGERVKCFDSERAANDQVKALYANDPDFSAPIAEKSGKNVEEYDNSLNDFIDRVRSAFSRQYRPALDGEYAWAADVFPDHVVVRIGDKYYRVSMEVSEEAITFAPRLEWEAVKVSYVTELLQLGRLRDVMIISEFKGKPPAVPFAAGVDVEELTDGDEKPVFVTLPLGLVNAKSGNLRFYDEKFVKELEKQVIANKPVGLMGHLKLEDRATEFPMEAVHWVGATRVGELLWGKGYVPPGEPRARLRRYKATKTKIATSIDCIAEGIWDDTVQAYRMKADTLRLGQIDIAPADRAGIADLAAVPHLTSEMLASGDDEQEDFQDDSSQEDSMDKAQVIREMTAEDAKILPEPVRAEVLKSAQPAPEVAVVQELRAALGVDDKADLKAIVSEMRQKQETQAKAAIKARVIELATPDPKRKAEEDKSIKIDSVRAVVVEMVNTRNPESVEQAETIYQEVAGSDLVRELLKSHVQSTMGPRQGTPVAGQNGAPKYFVIPQEAANG